MHPAHPSDEHTQTLGFRWMLRQKADLNLAFVFFQSSFNDNGWGEEYEGMKLT